MKTKLILPVLLLFLGGTLGYIYRDFRSGGEREETPSSTITLTKTEKAEESAAKARIAALRERISKLEKLLAARQQGKAGVQADQAEEFTPAVAENSTPITPYEVDPGANRLEQILRLQREDPKRFVHLTNDMMRTMRWQVQQANVRKAYFQRANEELMTTAERETHEELLSCQEALARIAELGGIWDRSAEVENARLAEKREIESRLVELYHEEARTLLRLKALDLGFVEADAEEVAETVSGLLRATYNKNEYIGKMD